MKSRPGPDVTVELLCTEADFNSMREACREPGDYARYRENAGLVLRDLHRHGGHVWVRPLDPDDYRAFCADEGVPTDSARSRAQYCADRRFLPPRPYTGEPLDVVLDHLIDQRDDERTASAALELLDLATTTSPQSRDPSLEAARFGGATLIALVNSAGPGHHRLTCVMDAGPDQLSAKADFEQSTDRLWSYGPRLDIVATLLAAAYALGESATVTLQSADTICGWHLLHDHLHPLTAVETRSAHTPEDPTKELHYKPGHPLPH